MINDIYRIPLALALSVAIPYAGAGQLSTPVNSQKPARATHIRMMEPNLYAPDLYADNLAMQVILVDMPGADMPDSSWEMEYKLYFVSEAEFKKVVDNALAEMAKQGQSRRVLSWDPRPAHFPEKIMLAEGEIKISKPDSLMARTFLKEKIDFKSKIPDKLRTKFARLMTSYSVKIFDARLNNTLYHSGAFLTFPFNDDQNGPEKAIPRATIYTNFIVTPKGQIFASQMPRKRDDTKWP